MEVYLLLTCRCSEITEFLRCSWLELDFFLANWAVKMLIRDSFGLLTRFQSVIDTLCMESVSAHEANAGKIWHGSHVAHATKVISSSVNQCQLVLLLLRFLVLRLHHFLGFFNICILIFSDAFRVHTWEAFFFALDSFTRMATIFCFVAKLGEVSVCLCWLKLLI